MYSKNVNISDMSETKSYWKYRQYYYTHTHRIIVLEIGQHINTRNENTVVENLQTRLYNTYYHV